MKGFWTVFKYTFMNRLRAKSFLVSTIIFVVLLSALVNLPSIISYFSNDKASQIGIFTDSVIAPALEDYYAEQESPSIELVHYPDQGSAAANEAFAKSTVLKKEVKGFLVMNEVEEGAFPEFSYYSQGSFMQTGSQEELRAVLQNVKTTITLSDLNLTEDQKERLFSSVTLNGIQVNTSGTDGGSAEGITESEQVLNYILVYALMILLFMALSIYGNMTASEITAEKSSRVMEILITSVSPLKQMFGKVFGMFVLGITQIVIFMLTVVINLNLPNNKDFLAGQNMNLGDISPMLYVYFVLFYLLGFFLYVLLYAAVGSIVSRTEDLGQASMPLTFLSLGAFYIGLYGINAPTSAFIKVTSFIPFFTPNVMFLRIGMNGVPAWEIWLSIAILLVTIFVVGWLSAKIYRTGVLMYGKRPSIKEIRKAMKAYKA